MEPVQCRETSISSFIGGSFPLVAAALTQLHNHLQTREISDPACLTYLLQISYCVQDSRIVLSFLKNVKEMSFFGLILFDLDEIK